MYHCNCTNYNLFNVNCKSFNRIYGLVAEIQKFKKLNLRKRQFPTCERPLLTETEQHASSPSSRDGVVFISKCQISSHHWSGCPVPQISIQSTTNEAWRVLQRRLCRTRIIIIIICTFLYRHKVVTSEVTSTVDCVAMVTVAVQDGRACVECWTVPHDASNTVIVACCNWEVTACVQSSQQTDEWRPSADVQPQSLHHHVVSLSAFYLLSWLDLLAEFSQ